MCVCVSQYWVDCFTGYCGKLIEAHRDLCLCLFESLLRCSIQQDRQCTYSVTLRSVHVTIIVVEKKYYIFCVGVCSLLSRTQSAYAVLYCHLCPAPLHNIFLTLSHKRHDFRKKVTEHKMCVLIFSTILCETFLILRRNQRDIVINTCWRLHVNYPLCVLDFNGTWIIWTDFRKKKILKYEFRENVSSWSGVVACVRTDKQMEWS